MDTGKSTAALRGLSVGSLVVGALGAACYWWVPMGMVLSLAGLLFGLVDWTMARRRSLDFRLSLIGMLISAGALTLCIAIAALGLQTWTFGGR